MAACWAGAMRYAVQKQDCLGSLFVWDALPSWWDSGSKVTSFASWFVAGDLFQAQVESRLALLLLASKMLYCLALRDVAWVHHLSVVEGVTG